MKRLEQAVLQLLAEELTENLISLLRLDDSYSTKKNNVVVTMQNAFTLNALSKLNDVKLKS
jgi:hypothetical protein